MTLLRKLRSGVRAMWWVIGYLIVLAVFIYLWVRFGRWIHPDRDYDNGPPPTEVDALRKTGGL